MAALPTLTTEQADGMVRLFTPCYRVREQVGSGRFGQVFLAQDDLKSIAIKILPLEFRDHATRGKSQPVSGALENRDWRRLTQRIYRLHHPSLVLVRDFFRYVEEDAASPVQSYGLIYMDYWPWNLWKYVPAMREQGESTPVRQRELLCTLANLLCRLRQDTGLLMTDLKPSNILVRASPHGNISMAITDLGGLHREGAAALERVDTTREYWAPELHNPNNSEVDETALVYNFGLIGYLILEGTSATKAANFNAAQQVRLSSGPHELEPCRRIVQRCLSRERSERFADFSSVDMALREARAHWLTGGDEGAARRSALRNSLDATRSSPHPQLWQEPLTAMTFVRLPGGRFRMGQRDDEQESLRRSQGEKRYKNWFARELPVHDAEVTEFWMASHPVTRGQFRMFVDETLYLTDAEQEGWAFGLLEDRWGEYPGVDWRNPGFPQQDDHPVVCVSWFDACAFIQWLALRTGISFALPTEAQWEYACRAGTDTPFYFGETLLAHQANFLPVSGGVQEPQERKPGTTPVGSYPANGFGLFDMHGNVWEWCEDGFETGFYATPAARIVNPVCRHNGAYRVRRGGSWNYLPEFLRSAYRGRNHSDSSYSDIGFRLAIRAG